MTPNAVYSATGRIEKIFLFDTKEFDLKSQEHEHRFLPVLHKYMHMAQDLNALHPEQPVILHVFFRVRRKGQQTPAWLDEENHIYFIPVNLNGVPVSIPTQWIQDAISVPGPGTLCFSKGFDPRLKDILIQYLEPVTVTESAMTCPEGNLLRGKNGSYEYIVKSTYRRGTCMEADVEDITGIDPDNIYSLEDSNSRGIDGKVLFHSDVYCTIAGDLGDNKELILVADPFEESWPKFTENMKGIIRRFRKHGRYNPTQFVIGRLPLVMITDGDRHLTHAFSYNNCLVENYLDEDKVRRLYFYFPDYREYAKPAPISPAAAIKLNALVEEKVHEPALMAGMLALAVDPHEEPAVNPPMISRIEEKIRMNLGSILDEIPNLIWDIRFVRHDFRTSSRSRGALHCLAKVVQRNLGEPG
jgi:hypothetical protein